MEGQPILYSLIVKLIRLISDSFSMHSLYLQSDTYPGLSGHALAASRIAWLHFELSVAPMHTI